MIVHAFPSLWIEKEGGVSRETPNRGSHRCYHLLFDTCRSCLESIVIR